MGDAFQLCLIVLRVVKKPPLFGGRMSKHLSDKLQKKLVKEEVSVKDNNIRFTATHYDGRGKVLGRDWYQGFIAVTNKRLVLASDGIKFLNIKRSDERYAAIKFLEDNVACLEITCSKESKSKRRLVFHIYTSKVNKVLKKLNKL